MVETEMRDRFGCRGDPTTRCRLEEDQDLCDVRSDAWDPVPALFCQRPDVLRQAENVSVRWSGGSLPSED